MHIDDFVNKELLLYTRENFESLMKGRVKFTKENFSNATAGMGAFSIEYLYLEKEYRIIFEYENMYFNIDIFNENNAKISLGEICIKILKCEFGQKWADWVLKRENIHKSIEILSKVINDNLYFYVYKDGKVFRYENGKINRIKDLSTLNLNII